MNTQSKAPTHVAIIMDGNGRWARRRKLPHIAGHRMGVKAVKEALKAAIDSGVKILTLYAFSTENWKRPMSEISGLFKLLEDYLTREGEELYRNNVRLQVIGRIEELPNPLRRKIDTQIRRTRTNDGLILNIALNYGGRSEIIGAVKHIVGDAKAGKVEVANIDEKLFADYLYTKGLPDPDLVIRTSGEFRISNFLLWQIAYSEICVVKKLWPDFKGEDFKKCIDEYGKRERRFGGS